MSSKQVLLQPAYVLHRRAYRETSFLIELFTRDYGRITLVARGVRKTHSGISGLLQPFSPLLVSWAGKGELMTLSYVESMSVATSMSGDGLFVGLYLNELLMYLLQKWDAHVQLFIIYDKTLLALQQWFPHFTQGQQEQLALQPPKMEQKILRSFEKSLLEELGYGVFPRSNRSLQNAFLPDRYYRFIFEQGFILGDMTEVPHSQSNVFFGKNLLAIANDDWQEEAVLQDAKRLTRLMLASLLGSRQIHSRQLLITPT